MKSTELYREYGIQPFRFKSTDAEAMDLINKAAKDHRWYDIVDDLNRLRATMRIQLDAE